MVSHLLLLNLLAAYFSAAIPLNINLGAYSPALVVGDGEISFGGPEKASELLQTLSTGAENGAVAAGTAPRVPESFSSGTGTTANPAAATSSQMPAQASTAGVTSPLVGDANSNAVPVGSPDPSSPMPAEFISHKLDSSLDPVQSQKYPVIDIREPPSKHSISMHSEPVTTSGHPSEPMSYRSLPVASDVKPKEPMAYRRKLKRDIDGFREALQFARDAQKNQPKVVLGQGITQFPGSAVPVNSAANGALPPGNGAAAATKRSLDQVEEAGVDDDKLGMTLIAIGEI